MKLSDDQAATIAQAIYKDIRTYVDAHADAYRLFLEQEKSKENNHEFKRIESVPKV